MIVSRFETRSWTVEEDDTGHLTVVPRLDNVYDLSIGALGLRPRRVSIHETTESPSDDQTETVRARFAGMHKGPGKGWFRKLFGD